MGNFDKWLNITMHQLVNFFPPALDKTRHSILGYFSTKVKIPWPFLAVCAALKQ
jgi:hypothetical protein